MQYQVVSSRGWTPDSAVKELERKVNDLIKEGWEPIGGVVVTAFNDNVYQALIKRQTVFQEKVKFGCGCCRFVFCWEIVMIPIVDPTVTPFKS